MEKNPTKRSAKEIQAAEEAWEEIGAALAAAVVDGGKTRFWVWDLIKPLGLYKRWMIGYWIEKYETLHRQRLETLKKNKRTRKKVLELVPVLDERPD